jgi:hypothetical protein
MVVFVVRIAAFRLMTSMTIAFVGATLVCWELSLFHLVVDSLFCRRLTCCCCLSGCNELVTELTKLKRVSHRSDGARLIWQATHIDYTVFRFAGRSLTLRLARM